MHAILPLAVLLLSLTPLAAQQALQIPDTVSGNVINLTLQTGSRVFYSGKTTQTMGVNGSFLGPTLILQRGQQADIRVQNQLGEPTTLHWHGMHVAPENDGGPYIVIPAGQGWNPVFTVLDQASTHWYHPHLHMHTNEHVQMGIAGMIIVRDTGEVHSLLPRTYGVDDFPVILQTKAFDASGQIVVLSAMDTALMVNGTLRPYLEVPAQMVRLRLLNGSSERIYEIGFNNDRVFQQIGSDGGLLSAPVSLTRLRLAPGERAEIVVDLKDLENQTHRLISYGSELPSGMYGAAQPGIGPGQTIPDYTLNPLNGADFNLLELRVKAPSANPVTSLPSTLVSHQIWNPNDADTTRIFTFTMANPGPTGIQGPFYINNTFFDHDVINERIPFNNIEIWELRNQSPIAHPFHIHNVPFYILSINSAAPPVNMRGRKDVVLVPGGNGVVRFITRFEDFWNDSLPYMYHCHMLTHEDDGMMGTFLVEKPKGSGTGLAMEDDLNWSVYPNPAQETLHCVIDCRGLPAVLVLCDQQGRELYRTDITRTETMLELPYLSDGVYYACLTTSQGTSRQKLVIVR